MRVSKILLSRIPRYASLRTRDLHPHWCGQPLLSVCCSMDLLAVVRLMLQTRWVVLEGGQWPRLLTYYRDAK